MRVRSLIIFQVLVKVSAFVALSDFVPSFDGHVELDEVFGSLPLVGAHMVLVELELTVSHVHSFAITH